MDIALLDQYATIVAQIKALESQRELLLPTVIAHLREQNVTKAQTERGTFTVAKVVRYKFPAKVEALKLAYADAKDHAIESGEAKAEESDTLRFQAK